MTSHHDSGYERNELEKYYTPTWAVEALKACEEIEGHILDPCAGDGKILDCFTGSFGFDIAPERQDIIQADYLVQPMHGFESIITNPPYGKGGRLAVQFIEKALEDAPYVAMLLRVDFDSGSTRKHLFGDNPWFKKKIVLTKRLRWTNLEQKEAGPTVNHAWFIWDRGNHTWPIIEYYP